MLPQLRKQQESAVVASEPIKRTPDEGAEEYDALESAAEELCHAITSKDFKAIAVALRAAFELMESEPHEEGPHLG